MKRILAILRSIFVSVELLVIVLVFTFYLVCPSWFENLSQRIGQRAEFLKYLGLLPVGLFVFNANTVKKILLPDADKKSNLQSWEHCWALKSGCVIALIYAFLFLLGGFASLLFDWHQPEPHQSAFLVTSLTGAFVVSGSLFFAHIRIEELFRQYSPGA